MDTDKSGALEYSEFVKFCKKVKPDMSDDEILADWKDLDLNKDSKVSQDELFMFLKKKLEVTDDSKPLFYFYVSEYKEILRGTEYEGNCFGLFSCCFKNKPKENDKTKNTATPNTTAENQ